MDKASTRTLIEAAGTATCLSVLKGMAEQTRHSCWSMVVDMDPKAPGRYMADDFAVVPSSKDPTYADEILYLCEKNKIDLFIPIMDYGFRSLTLRKQDFLAIGCLPLIAGPASMDICMDKYNTYQFFREHGIPTPKTVTVAADVANYPCILKPRTGGVASQGVFLIKDAKTITHFADEENVVFQAHISGREFTADCLSSLNGDTFIATVIRERVTTKGGVSIQSKLVSGPEAERITPFLQKIALTLKLPGAYNIQGFIGKDGEIHFIEVNPRFAGTHTFSIRAGLNSIAYILDMLKKQKRPEQLQCEITINPRLEMTRYWNEIFIENGVASTWTKPFLKQH